MEEARRRASRRRRFYLGLAALALFMAAGAYLFLRGGDTPPVTDARGWHAGATPVPAGEVLARRPYMGVACSIPGDESCDRVGLSIDLREPGRRVDASIAGRVLALDDPVWSGPRVKGGREIFAGFLEPAGMGDAGLEVPGGVRGKPLGPPPEVPIKVWVLSRGGDASTTTLRIPLFPGWG